VISRDEAWALVTDWVESESLRRHCLAVEAAMRAYAGREGADPELWGATGLLHDADYERFPDLATGHPRMIMAELEHRGAPAEMIRAIASHAESLGVEPEAPIERTLVAVDELCGFLVACAVVRPTGIHGLGAKSVRKKLKQPSFAAAVNRADVVRGAEELGVELDDHIAFVIAALEPHAEALGLDGAG
jgi:putative nucleotidyltransferase with HDIG domain